MSLAVKFALVTTVTIALLMLVFGIVTYSTSKNALNREIDAFGINLARVLAVPDATWWGIDHGSIPEAVRRIAESYDRYDALLPEGFGLTYRKPDRDRNADPQNGIVRSGTYRSQYEEFLAELERTRTRNRNRLRHLTRYGSGEHEAPSEIIDAFIRYADKDESVVRANPEAKGFAPIPGERRYAVDVDGRTIRTEAVIIHGQFEDFGAARLYSYPIRDPRGSITHRAYVFLSEKRIQSRLTSLLVKILLCTVAFIVIGAAVSFLVTRQMTAPLKDLVDDIEIVSSGDFSHRTRAHSSDEIGLLARTFDRMVRSLNEARTERSQHQALKHEVAIASEVQGKLIPESIPRIEGFEIEVLHVPAGVVGGAYYDFFDLPEGRCGLLVAEGSGTGVPAALTVVMARSLLRSEGERSHDPEVILKRVNAALSRDMRKGMYVSVLLAVLDPRTRVIRACGAGNVPFFHFQSSDKNTELIVPDGIALGFDPGPVFDRSLKAREVRLGPRDRIVIANSAPPRLRNQTGEELGSERWKRLVDRASPKNSSAFVNLIGGWLSGYRGPEPSGEDIIVVTLEAAGDAGQ